jgi:hypothetical protein
VQESLTEEYFCSKTNTGFEVLGAANLLDEMNEFHFFLIKCPSYHFQDNEAEVNEEDDYDGGESFDRNVKVHIRINQLPVFATRDPSY